jgi:hypothetical protein
MGGGLMAEEDHQGKLSANLQSMSSDEAKLYKPSPTRYMELRKLLLNPSGPSIHIKTAELAAVVQGKEDILLPEWSTNEAFEAELEMLISKSSIVSICWDCDGIRINDRTALRKGAL